jgi:hypothetical protein
MFEVGDASPSEVRISCNEVAKACSDGSPTFILPMRNGKVTTKVLFEGDILKLVKRMVEIKDGEIVLKGGEPFEVDVNVLEG